MTNVDPVRELEIQLRRLVPRQFTDWPGRYLLEGAPPTDWRDCRVTDVSMAGAGLLLSGATVEEAEDRGLLLAVELQAVVRHVGEAMDGLRAGVQFAHLSDAEKQYLLELRQLGARW
jgi:hypothetical protein